jgi:hypothetical protein
MQRSGQARHHTIQRGRIDDMGKFSQRQPRRAVTGSPSSRFERVSMGAVGSACYVFCICTGETKAKTGSTRW